jgi:hypothetical protein
MVLKSELEKKAQELGIKNVKNMTKDQLMELLRSRGVSVESKTPQKKTPVRTPVRPPQRAPVRAPVRPPDQRVVMKKKAEAQRRNVKPPVSSNLTGKQREEIKRREMVSSQNLQQRNAKMQEIKQAAQNRLNANQSRPQPILQKTAKMAEMKQATQKR